VQTHGLPKSDKRDHLREREVNSEKLLVQRRKAVGGLLHPKTLARETMTDRPRFASWSAPALWRFGDNRRVDWRSPNLSGAFLYSSPIPSIQQPFFRFALASGWVGGHFPFQ
jgi:hypothetical protein